jgi:hypothetical protein
MIASIHPRTAMADLCAAGPPCSGAPNAIQTSRECPREIGRAMHALLYDWPWVGLAIGLLLLAGLLLWPTPDDATMAARFTRPSRLVWLPLPIYMLHQFEEHGIDLLGRHYHFQADFCHRLGHVSVDDCPGTPLFIFAVNVGSVWIAGVLSGLVGLRRPLVTTGMIGIIAANALAHLGPFIVSGGDYNPGVLTGALLFLPAAVLLFRALLAQGVIRPRDIGLGLLMGLAVHAVLISSLLAADHGLIGQGALATFQLANGFVPLLVSAVVPAHPHREEARAPVERA